MRIPIALLLVAALGSDSLWSACIEGTVRSTNDNMTIDWATLSISELDRSEFSHDGGLFRICGLPIGRHTIECFALGYAVQHRDVTIESAQDTVTLDFRLEEAPIESAPVVVTGYARRKNGSEFDGSVGISGTRLAEERDVTLAATLQSLPGASVQSYGESVARPVLRGMDGSRVSILSNGLPTVDASDMSADHAVTIEARDAKGISIIRGPDALLYSSNPVGGVVNVERELQAYMFPDRVHGVLSLSGSAVSPRIGGYGALSVPVGPVSLSGRLSASIASDTRTPIGRIENTESDAYAGEVGIFLPFERFSLGGRAELVRNDYGIPGGIESGHEEGVDIQLRKRRLSGTARYYPDSDFWKKLVLDLDQVVYSHSEFETATVIGTEYGIVDHSARFRVDHDSLPSGITDGTFMFNVHHKNMVGNGVGIPETDRLGVAVAVAERVQIGQARVKASARFDWARYAPTAESLADSDRWSTEERSGASGGLSFGYEFDDRLSSTLSVIRSTRLPLVQELFSSGPHLATYTYEVGNSDLRPEHATSFDLSTRLAGDKFESSASLFYSYFDAYATTLPNGDTNVRTRLPVYQFRTIPAETLGAEASMAVAPVSFASLDGTISYVRGTFRSTSDPLPLLPPLNGSLSLRLTGGPIQGRVALNWAGAKNTTAEFVSPTDGYGVIDVTVHWRTSTQSTLHTIVIAARNVFDAVYRNHLSRIKDVYPEPGRSLSIRYDFDF